MCPGPILKTLKRIRSASGATTARGRGRGARAARPRPALSGDVHQHTRRGSVHAAAGPRPAPPPLLGEGTEERPASQNASRVAMRGRTGDRQ